MADTTHSIRIRMDTSGVRTGTAEVQAGLRQMDVSADRAGQKVGLIGTAFTRLRTQILSMNSALAGFSAGFAALGAVRVLSDFDDKMADVRAVTLATDADFKTLRDTALELGATTRFTAAQAAEGLELLARAGADAKGSIALIGPTLKLAQAENLSLADSADYLAKITQGMRLELSEGARVADVLAAAASATATDVRQLGNAFKYAAPIAAGFKIPVEEVAAALGVLANSGLTGDQGGTAIRGILSKIAAPTKEFTKDLKAVGLEISALDPKTNSLVSIIEKLGAANVGTSESFDLFKQRAGAGAEILINNIDKVKELRTQLEGARGNLDKKFEIKADTLQSDLLRVLSSVQALILAIGDAGLTRVLRTAAQVFSTVFRGIADTVTALVPYVVNVGIAFGVIFSPTILAAFAAGMVRLIPLFAAFASQVLAAAAALAVFAAANPFTALAVAVGVGITALRQFGGEARVVGTQFATVGDVLDTVWANIKTAGTNAFTAVGDAATIAGRTMVTAFQTAAGLIGPLLDGIAARARDIAAAIANKLSGTTIGNALSAAKDFIGGQANAVAGASVGVFGGIASQADDLAQIRHEEAVGEALRATHAQLLKNAAAKKDSSVATRGAVEEEKNLRSAYSRTRDVLDSLFGQQHEALSNMAILNKLFTEGKVSVSEYADQFQRLRGQLLQNDQTLQGGVLKGFNAVAEGATKLGDHIGQAIVNGFSAASDAIADFAVTGKFNFSDLTSSILRDMTKLATNAIFGSLVNGLLGSIGGGAIGGAGALGGGGLGSLFGFASGGSFQVGGTGGTDSKVVAFKATPGEMVNVSTPGQARGGGQTIVNVNVQDIPGAQVDQRRSKGAGGADILDITISAMNQAMSSGKLDGSLRGRFGLTPSTVRR